MGVAGSSPVASTTAVSLKVNFVTIDKSLRRKGRLNRSRNVLNREERITFLKTEERWLEGRGPFGLPKVRVAKASSGKKKKEKKAEGEEAAPAKGAAAKGGAAKAAPAAKAAAPAKKK